MNDQTLKDQLETAWLAGWLEGEGTFTILRRPEGEKYWGGRVSGTSTDWDTIQRVHRIAGAGRVRPRTRKSERHKPSWNWNVIVSADLIDVIERVLPYLGERRTEAAKAVLVCAKRTEARKNTPRTGHGTDRRYRDWGCRCPRCRAGNAARWKSWYARNRARQAA